MRRYTTLLIVAFLLVVVVVTGSQQLAGSGHVEDGVAMRQLTVYTTLPAEHVAELAAAYEKKSRVRVTFVPLAGKDLIERASKGDPTVALVLADAPTLEELTRRGKFLPYVSEQTDAVPEHFKQAEGAWTGVWYDPIVFAMNSDYLRTLKVVPDTWRALAQPDARVGMTDFVAADAAANLLEALIAQFGEVEAFTVLRDLHPHVVQYTKYLSNPVRQVGMGEADVAIAGASETMRYVADGYPIRIVYPADGTAYSLGGAGILAAAGEGDRQAAGDFIDYLLSDDAQTALQSHGFYFLTTNPMALAYRQFAGKNIVLFQQKPGFSEEQKKAFLDRWVKYIRFSQ